MAEKQGAPSAPAPRYERGIFPKGMPISGVSKVVEAGIEALNPYPMNLETGERELAVPGLFEAIAAGGKGIASAIKDPVGTYEKVSPMLDEMGQRMVGSTTLRPGQMEVVDGELRPLTSAEVVQERIDAGMDPTVALAGAAPLARGVAAEGIGALAPEPGTVSAFLKGAEDLRKQKTLVEAPGKRYKDWVTDVNVKFKSEHPAFQNLQVSHVEPSPEGMLRYNAVDNMTGDNLGIVRVTVPTDDVYRASGGKYTGAISDSHDTMFLGGDNGLSASEIARRGAAVSNAEEELIDAIRFGDVAKGMPADFEKKFPDIVDESPARISEWLEENSDWLRQKAIAVAREREVLSGEMPKNTPVGFARFADIDVGGRPYMRLTEIQSDMFAQARKADPETQSLEGWGQNVKFTNKDFDKSPDLYPNMSKDDMPLKSSVLKGAVASAMERGADGVVLPNKFTSAGGVRYSDSNVKKLLNSTVKDLGEGYSFRKIEVPSYDQKGGTQMSEHYVLEWPDRAEVQGEMKFAKGGIVEVIKQYRRDGWMD